MVGTFGVTAEELQVKGVTVTVIDYLQNHKFSGMDNSYFSPSCKYAMNEASRNELTNKLNSQGLYISHTGGLCLSNGVVFNIDNVTIDFDGVWFVARKEIINKGEWVSSNDAIPLIRREIDDLKAMSCSAADKYIQDTGCLSVMVLIHISEIAPQNIVVNDSSNIFGESSLVDSMYREELSSLLDVTDSKKLKIASFKIQPENKLGYLYYLRDDTKIKENDFGQFMIIMNESYSMVDNSDFRDLFYFLDNYQYNPINLEEIKRDLYNAESLRGEINQHRKRLVEETSTSISWQQRLKYLEANRTDLLVNYEQSYENINEILSRIKASYGKQKELFEEMENANSPVALLYGDEVKPQLGDLSTKIENVETNLAQIEIMQDSIRNIYYGELGVAVSERAIYESWAMTNQAIQRSHEDNILVICISAAAFLISIIGIVASSYDRLQKDERYRIFLDVMILLILIVLGILLGMIGLPLITIAIIYVVVLVWLHPKIITQWVKQKENKKKRPTSLQRA